MQPKSGHLIFHKQYVHTGLSLMFEPTVTLEISPNITSTGVM